MKYITRREKGYLFKFNKGPAKYFSDARYGGKENAELAAIACRDTFLETGELLVPPNPVRTKRQIADHHKIDYRRFRDLSLRVGNERAIEILTDQKEETQHEL